MEVKSRFQRKKDKEELSDSVFAIEQIITQYTLMLSSINQDKERTS
jgi:hypothetical protein